MMKDDSHGLKFTDHHQTVALWAGTGGDVDSGLHFDQNKGGFMYLASGKKQIMMFPQSDYDNLYMRRDFGEKNGEESVQEKVSETLRHEAIFGRVRGGRRNVHSAHVVPRGLHHRKFHWN
jgi:hypothetical protein